MNKMRYFVFGVIVCVSIAIIAGFFVIDSPAHERLARFDEQRLSDLQALQNEITAFFASNQKLPTTLEELRGFESFAVPRDPQNRNPYEYTVESPRTFRLCAEFALPTANKIDGDGDGQPNPLYPGPYPVSFQSWEHGVGHACFELAIENPVANGSIPPVTVKPTDQ